MITPTRVTNKPYGSIQTFVCDYESTEQMSIKFEVVSEPPEDPMRSLMKTSAEHPSTTFFRSEEMSVHHMFGGMKKITLQLHPQLKLVVCSVYNRELMEVGKVTSMIERTGSRI